MANAWNALRKAALSEAVRKLLMPSLTRETAVALEREARVAVRHECGDALWRRIALAPWRPESNGEFDDDEVEVRVLAAVWGPGRAVQVDPLKPELKPPGTKRLKLKYDVRLSKSAFKFNMRRYTPATRPPRSPCWTRRVSSVWRCRLTLSNPS
jgi:hypothetical protein